MDRHDAEGLALSATLLAAEHVVLWPYRGQVPLLARYALGVAALNAGQTLAALRRGAAAPLRPWAYAAAGCAVVVTAHGLRALEHRRRRQTEQWAAAAGAWPYE